MIEIILVCFFGIKRNHPLKFNSSKRILPESSETFTIGIHWNKPNLWPEKWILHHDNGPSRTKLSAKQFYCRNINNTGFLGGGTSTVLAFGPIYIFHFTKIKNLESIRLWKSIFFQMNVTTLPKSLPANDIQICLQVGLRHCTASVKLSVENFEGDHTQQVVVTLRVSYQSRYSSHLISYRPMINFNIHLFILYVLRILYSILLWQYTEDKYYLAANDAWQKS
jgi:hypothetical protein